MTQRDAIAAYSLRLRPYSPSCMTKKSIKLKYMKGSVWCYYSYITNFIIYRRAVFVELFVLCHTCCASITIKCLTWAFFTFIISFVLLYLSNIWIAVYLYIYGRFELSMFKCTIMVSTAQFSCLTRSKITGCQGCSFPTATFLHRSSIAVKKPTPLFINIHNRDVLLNNTIPWSLRAYLPSLTIVFFCIFLYTFSPPGFISWGKCFYVDAWLLGNANTSSLPPSLR